MAGDEAHAAGEPAVREGDAQARGAAGGRGDSRDDLPGNAAFGEVGALLAAPAEHEGVAALDPDDGAPA